MVKNQSYTFIEKSCKNMNTFAWELRKDGTIIVYLCSYNIDTLMSLLSNNFVLDSSGIMREIDGSNNIYFSVEVVIKRDTRFIFFEMLTTKHDFNEF